MTLSEIYSHKTCNSRPSPLFKLCYRCSLEPRQKFNLTVSAETLVSKQAERIGISLNGDLRSGGGLLKYWPMWCNTNGPYVVSVLPKISKPIFVAAQVSPSGGSSLVSGGSGKFSPTWKAEWNLHHLIRWSV